jgi:glutamate synthase domain-containing protein 2
MKWIKEIRKRTLNEKPPLASGRSNKFGKISFDDLVFIPAQLTKSPVDYFRENISSETILGKLSKHPLTLETPILIAAMSFGALSKEAKITLAKASTLAGTADNTGEGGMLLEQRKYAKTLIAQYSTGRFGIDDDYLRKADAIEIKIGQGAKPGQGGLLPADKVTEEIAKIRKVQLGRDIHSPPRHLDINSIDELKQRINEIRRVTDGKPIFLKLGAGDIENDIELAVYSNPDVIVIDGMEGGTGAAPEVLLDDVGIPTLLALIKARKKLDKLNAKQELIIGGSLNKGADIAKALALGADAVILGFPLLIAMGCIYCRSCYLGKCPNGIATQDPLLRKKLNIDESAKKVTNFIKTCTEEIKMIAGAVGKNDIHKLCKEDLSVLNLEILKSLQ